MKKEKLQCGFGLLGLCCLDCPRGPCRIAPFQKDVQESACGEDAAIMVAKNLLKRLAIGAAISANYGRQLALQLLNLADSIDCDSQSVKVVATKLGIKGKDLSRKIALMALEDYSSRQIGTPTNWLKINLTHQRFKLLSEYKVLPYNIDIAIIETLAPMTRDINEIFLRGIKCSLANFNTLHLISDLRQIIGTHHNVSLPQWCLLKEVRSKKREVRSEKQKTELRDLLVENIINGEILGVALFIGCEELNQREQTILHELAKNNVLSLLSGCQDRTTNYTNLTNRVKKQLSCTPQNAVSWLKTGLSVGSCISAIWTIDFVNELANKLGVDVSTIPLIAIISEQVDRRIEVMAHWMMALGIPVYWMKIPTIMGSPITTEFYTKVMKERFGGYSIWGKDVTELIEILKERAKNSGIQSVVVR